MSTKTPPASATPPAGSPAPVAQEPEKTEEVPQEGEGAANSRSRSPSADSVDIENKSAAEAEDAAPPAEPEKSVEEELEDFVQKVIGGSAIPLNQPSPMVSVSTSTLLQMLGCESGPYVAKSSRPNIHPSYTTMSVLTRLGEEYRAKKTKMQDQYEDAVATLRKSHEELMETLHKEHDASLDATRQRFLEKAHKDKSENLEGNGNGSKKKLDPAELESEIKLLEKRILMSDSKKETSASLSARRLLSFWKAKYENLCGQFENQQEQHFAVKTKLDEAHALMGQSSKQLQMILTVLREKEQKERHRADALKTAYLKETLKRNVLAKEPVIKPSEITGAMMSHTRLMTIAQHGYDPSDNAATEAGSANGNNNNKSRHNASTNSIDSMDRSSVGAGAGAAAGSCQQKQVTFTRTAAQSPALQKLVQDTIIDAKQECTMLEASIADADRTITDLEKTLEEKQNQYAQSSANIPGSGASLIEEVISLQAQIDVHEALVFEKAVEKATQDCEHHAVYSAMVEKVERVKAEGREREEDTKRAMREKEVDMVRVRHRLNAGKGVTLSDFSDAPVKDPNLKLNVLKSRLAVIDCERQLLKAQLGDAAEAENTVMAALEERLRIPTSNKK